MSRLAAAVLACGVALSACSGSSLSSLSGAPSQRLTPPLGGASAHYQTSYTFQTVDDPVSTVNEVNGIDALSNIVGTVGSGSPSSPLVGYTSSPPYKSFTQISFGNAQGTVAMSSPVSNIVAGYVINPSQLTGIWAFIDVNGLFTLLKDRKEGTGKNGVTELLSVNVSQIGVGFYITKTGSTIPVEAMVATEHFTALHPPGMLNAEATGINAVDDVSGWETTANGTNGFLFRIGSYYKLSYSGASTTEALGLNATDEIAGFYAGSDGIKHGFILTGATLSPSQQVWQKIDDPSGVNGTVVTGINDLGDICGYYIDSNKVQHGFIATH
jgi:hypothetical protein